MKKLLELLNEYDDGMVSWYEEYFSTEGLFVTNAGQGFREEFILSKRYGFIDWLVENNKIDIDKLKFQSDFMFPLWKDFDQLGSEDIEEYSEYESLLMILAIQDNPIEFLVSILK